MSIDQIFPKVSLCWGMKKQLLLLFSIVQLGHLFSVYVYYIRDVWIFLCVKLLQDVARSRWMKFRRCCVVQCSDMVPCVSYYQTTSGRRSGPYIRWQQRRAMRTAASACVSDCPPTDSGLRSVIIMEQTNTHPRNPLHVGTPPHTTLCRPPGSLSHPSVIFQDFWFYLETPWAADDCWNLTHSLLHSQS